MMTPTKIPVITQTELDVLRYICSAGFGAETSRLGQAFIDLPGPLVKHCVARNQNAAPVRCKGWILLMSPSVTGRSLSPISKEITGLLPVSAWKFKGTYPTTMRDQDGPSPRRT
jgi:hypothetical protein